MKFTCIKKFSHVINKIVRLHFTSQCNSTKYIIQNNVHRKIYSNNCLIFYYWLRFHVLISRKWLHLQCTKHRLTTLIGRNAVPRSCRRLSVRLANLIRAAYMIISALVSAPYLLKKLEICYEMIVEFYEHNPKLEILRILLFKSIEERNIYSITFTFQSVTC